MYGLGIEKDDLTLLIFAALVCDAALEDQIDFASDMLVPHERIGGVGGDSIQDQFAASLSSQARHCETVAEIPPGQPVESSLVQVQAQEIIQRAAQNSR